SGFLNKPLDQLCPHVSGSGFEQITKRVEALGLSLGGGADGVDGSEQAENPRAFAIDGPVAEHGAALFARRRECGPA
ncbi:MAG: hypothetical protein WBX25_03655, partial [Rhodomicrobium sp.]